MKYLNRIKLVHQHDLMDCGPACLSMIASYHGRSIPLQYIREQSFIGRDGVTLKAIDDVAKEFGFRTTPAKLTTSRIVGDRTALLPSILYWNQNHFVVLYGIKKNFITGKTIFKIADPGHGLVKLSAEKFEKHWLIAEKSGIALFLEVTPRFKERYFPEGETISLGYILNYLKPYRIRLIWMFLFMLVGSGITLIFPFLTQRLIDEGVLGKDINFILMLLTAQLSLFIGSLVIDIFRNWIMLLIGTQINIRIISEFLKKILKLPLSFFDTKQMGDFAQRIGDHDRIENFLTSQGLLTFFSILTFSVFFGVLGYYSLQILFIYFGLSSVSILWSLLWMGKRKVLDYYRFQQRSDTQESMYEIINGVSEIKLNQLEDYKRSRWEQIQARLFSVNMKILKVDQAQIAGFDFINQLKNIIVTFFAASMVVEGKMTLGALLSISYIIGQMNSPINQLIVFFRSYQDAKLSLLRLNEVHNYREEESPKTSDNELLKRFEADNYDFSIDNVSFQYEGPKSSFVLKNLKFVIPHNSITAIVGASGSGKTTLLKVLLKFYEPIEGQVLLNDIRFSDLSHLWLRENTGVVMQDGFIFGDTIQQNIVCGDEKINDQRLLTAIKIANLEEFISSLALGLNTKIGASGNGISGGQKQRILIARAVYKNPQFLFFDEATSALDAENEKIIHDNLQTFFKGKTVVIIAHRLSTVKNADQIIVLDKGEVAEIGNHETLTKKRGKYYELVKNQLELGN